MVIRKRRVVFIKITILLTSEDIAETILWCLNRPQHVNIQELVIVPTDQPGVPAFSKIK